MMAGQPGPADGRSALGSGRNEGGAAVPSARCGTRAWSFGLLLSVSAFAASACSFDFDSAFSEVPDASVDGAPADSSDVGAYDVVSDGSASSDGPEDSADVDAADTGRELDCLNGADDDHDGLADCDDDDCSELTRCVPRAPLEWGKPSWVFEGPAGAELPTCPPGQQSLVLGRELAFEPLSCSCACGDLSGGACKIEATAWETGQCDGVPTLLQDGCNPLDEADGISLSVSVTGSPACPVAVDQDGVEGAQWAVSVRACTPPATGAGCTPEQVCVSAPPEGSARLCLLREGSEAPCPGGYGERHVGGVGEPVDGRTCGQGTCKCLAQPSCSCTVRTYASTDCTSLPHQDLDGAGCHSIGASMDSAYVPASAPSGACEPTGVAQLEGAIEPDVPVVICCQ